MSEQIFSLAVFLGDNFVMASFHTWVDRSTPNLGRLYARQKHYTRLPHRPNFALFDPLCKN